jgi:nanoRNase/pAp phosphatase (c-di-AMP/oligoRNAs hydrolase)
MDHPFPKSTTAAEKCKRLLALVHPEDAAAILIDADPDAMASALALKRLFWRKVRKATIYHINPIKRADNLAFIRLLKIDLQHIRNLKPTQIDKWAIVDSQPDHHKEFSGRPFDIIIDHHPLSPPSKAPFVDIREDYGANSTIMTEYLRAAKIRPSPKLATALFYGIKTDTDNFVRHSLPNDINAFRYLYKFTNGNIINKIESSEMTRKTLASYRMAIDRLSFFKDTAYIHMGEVQDPDILVVMADFFLGLSEATWSVVSGVYNKKLVVILRNANFRGDAGKAAQELVGRFGGSGGGHKSAGRAEIPTQGIGKDAKGNSPLERFVLKSLGISK